MENEKKEVINLTDEELKEVTGGVMATMNACGQFPRKICAAKPHCEWKNNQCVAKD